ncbi:DNA mismatch repair protein MLH1 [Dendrobium catenatum]|uniref:DNA mismatch repair protein MLH1 n=1 Tax=Dendrobium catenatum TaxID=906689 RepID=A0A2I0X258_9ASPA|nr:DNA mismatch repair protein MLH1 [Dendrobium catenatum]
MQIEKLEVPSPPTAEPEVQWREPPTIRRLEESVTNRIAAGEVVQRPSSVVKELVENSLDAGATSISVVVKDGGLKLIQVSDNGHGSRLGTIRIKVDLGGDFREPDHLADCNGYVVVRVRQYEDLPILCERHTTSKLTSFEDLQTIKSMGFRGEALASMTYVGHVTVMTITDGQLHGYRVSYRDGVMEHEPKPCAAVKGTQIMVENLFYNMLARRKALQNASDDYPKIVDLISRFAIYHTNVSFTCRKHGANKADVSTVIAASRLDAIKMVYGMPIARDLMEIGASDNNPTRSVFEMDGFISSANYMAKKTTMVLFINDRLVECTPLKRAIEVAYSATLTKASKPFVFMSIRVPSEHVDVNVHPTKREVSLLNQESLVNTIQDAIESKLMSSNNTRTFHTQAVTSTAVSHLGVKKDTQAFSTVTKSQKLPINKMVRTDSRDPSGRLHAYLQDRPGSQNEKKPDLASVRNAIRLRRNPKEASDLTSIQELVRDIDSNVHPGLLDIVNNCTYVGLADEIFALLQHNTHLYLVNVVNVRYTAENHSNGSGTKYSGGIFGRIFRINPLVMLTFMKGKAETIVLKPLSQDFLPLESSQLLSKDYGSSTLLSCRPDSKELMYQQVIRRFGNFNAIQLSEPAPLLELLMIALKEEDLDSASDENDAFRKKISEMNTDLLMKKAELLDEYFSIHIDEQQNLTRLPVVLDQHTPDMDHVPEFLLSLGNDVVWTSEKECFQTIAAAIGDFYAIQPPVLPNPSGNGIQFYKNSKRDAGTNAAIELKMPENVSDTDIDGELLAEAETAWAQREWTIQHVLFPSMRLFLKPPNAMAKNGTFVQVTSLDKLYKIFERC